MRNIFFPHYLSGEPHKLARQDTLLLLHKKDATLRLHLFVGIPGLEPGMTGPESVVLPLHHIPILCLQSFCFLIAIAKVRIFF